MMSHLGINSQNAQLWAFRYELSVKALKYVLICVKNDSASADLVKYITSPEWVYQLTAICLTRRVRWDQAAKTK